MTKPQLYLWPNRALVLGVAGDSQLHAHFAAQISYGLHGPFQVRCSDSGEWHSTQAAIFAANAAHQIDSHGQALAHLFIATSAAQFSTQIQADFHQSPPFQALLPGLQTLLQGQTSFDEAQRILQAWLACVLSPQQLAQTRDQDARKQQRMARIFAHIESSMHAANGLQLEKVSAQELAKLVHLSSSRFLHLFRAEAGMSLSRYLLWMRLQIAINAIGQGANITTAAHQAGFADLAHMSRSFRATIGIPASHLHKIQIHSQVIASS